VLCGRWETYPREFAKCRRCRKAKYCGKECQSTAWSEGHRFWCSAKDVDEEGHERRERHHDRDRDHHRDGHERDGDVEEESQGTGGGGGGSRRERRDRRERERDRRDDGADAILATTPAMTTTITLPRTATTTVTPTRRALHVGVVGEPPNAVLVRAQQQSEQHRQALENTYERRADITSVGGSGVSIGDIRMTGSTGADAAGNDMVLG